MISVFVIKVTITNSLGFFKKAIPEVLEMQMIVLVMLISRRVHQHSFASKF